MAQVWFDLPDYSPEFNDTLTLENVGDEDLQGYSPPWVDRMYWGCIGIMENTMETTI